MVRARRGPAADRESVHETMANGSRAPAAGGGSTEIPRRAIDPGGNFLAPGGDPLSDPGTPGGNLGCPAPSWGPLGGPGRRKGGYLLRNVLLRFL